MLFLFSPLFAQEKWDCLIFWDQGIGCWEDGVLAFEAFLDWSGYTHRRIRPYEINRKDLLQNTKLLYVPGGDADYYYDQVNQRGIRKIQEFVASGGIYLGICAGAEWACTNFYWDGIHCQYGLNLVDITAIGPINQIHPWPNYGLTTILWSEDQSIIEPREASSEILYFGGSYFNLDGNRNVEVLGRYADFESRAAAVYAPLREGHVILFGPHPEIEENSQRDNSIFAGEWEDPESDWPTLLEILNQLGF